VSKLTSRSAFEGILTPGRSGKAEGEAGVTVTERVGLGLASLEVREGQSDALKRCVREAHDMALPEGSTVASGKDVMFIGTGPGQWLAVSETRANEDLAADLATKLDGLASIADQSSGRGVLRLSGPRVRDCLAKGLAIDLDPRIFPAGCAATSTLSHMGVLLWREGEAECYDIVLFRSVAGSFWRWLAASAAEYGCEVVTAS
jgi:heterotetrameric sarcosine oxidase gamma subunit